jgi:hypothetical protein
MIKGYNINSNFDSGNINELTKYQSNNIINIEVEINKDPYPSHIKNKYKYWYYFKVDNLEINKTLTIILKNINNIEGDWKGFKAPYSYNNEDWFRIENTSIDLINKTITWTIKPKKRVIWFAYYPPYPFKRSETIAKKYKSSVLGNVNNKPIYYIKKGTGNKHVWILARQHPGETIGSWMLEGFLKKLFKRKNKFLFQHFTFHIIINANPLGTINGNWYTTPDGINLNRDWIKKKSKNVQIIAKEILKTECYLCIDLHGDEGSFKHFIAYCYEKKNKLYNKINDIINKENTNFRKTNYYKHNYSRHAKYSTYDCYFTGLTFEGAMKHANENDNTLQYTPLKIGSSFIKMFKKLAFENMKKNKTMKKKYKIKNKTLKR